MTTNERYNWDNTWIATPEGFNRPVRIRRVTTRKGEARFQYFGQALRWLPISRDIAAMAIVDAVATGQTPSTGE